MERSCPVNHETRPTTERHAPFAGSFSSDNREAPPALVDQMEDLLGERFEPDPLFFVESWTVGVEKAAERFEARRQAATQRNFDASTFRPFAFSEPLLFVEDDPRTASSRPAGVYAAWRDCYGAGGSSPSSSESSIPYNEATFSSRAPGQPLTLEDARRLLGVAATSTHRQIKTAYRQLVRRYHPDRLHHSSEQEQRIATDRMTSINEAYHLICGMALVPSH